MHFYVGIDAAKDIHWACVISADAKPIFSHAVRNDPEGIAALIGEL